MSLLVTSSFIDAVEWLESAPNSINKNTGNTWKTDAYNGLRDQLARAPWGAPNPDIQRGMDFEARVYAVLNKKDDQKEGFSCSPEFKEFLEACRGGEFQKKLKKFEMIDGREFCLYGKADVFFPNIIKDIKATGTYGGQNKYLGKAQHLLYCHMSEISAFEYLVAEFGPVPNLKIKRAINIRYDAPDAETLKDIVYARIRKAVGFVEQDSELWKLYTTTFSRY